MKLENISYSTIGKNEKSLLNEIKYIRAFLCENIENSFKRLEKRSGALMGVGLSGWMGKGR